MQKKLDDWLEFYNTWNLIQRTRHWSKLYGIVIKMVENVVFMSNQSR